MSIETFSLPERQLRICILTHELKGPIGETYGKLAQALAKDGHQVTLLHLADAPLAAKSAPGRSEVLGRFTGVELVRLPPHNGAVDPEASAERILAYRAYLWLQEQSRFDLVHYSDFRGAGSFISTAKRQGRLFRDTLLCVTLFGPTLWQRAKGGEFVRSTEDLELDHLERQSVARADWVLSRNTELRGFLLSESWQLGHGEATAEPHLVAEDGAFLDWHRRLAPSQCNVGGAKSTPALPRVSVGLVHYNRPNYLKQAIDSLLAQDYPNLQVILVDDGSTQPAALAYLDALEETFAHRGWQILRQDNRYLGAARNAAARAANGTYLLFMDDDNVAKPHEVSTLVAVAEHTGADVVTCHMEVFYGEKVPLAEGGLEQRWPLGSSLGLGLLWNAFGDANALWRRSAFMGLGGFTEDYGIGHEDWELFARAALAGLKFETVPEALFYYRKSAGSMLRSTQHQLNHLRSLRPYLLAVPPWLRPVLRLHQGQFFALHPPRTESVDEQAATAASDVALLRLKDRVYRLLVPYPVLFKAAQRFLHVVLRWSSRTAGRR